MTGTIISNCILSKLTDLNVPLLDLESAYNQLLVYHKCNTFQRHINKSFYYNLLPWKICDCNGNISVPELQSFSRWHTICSIEMLLKTKRVSISLIKYFYFSIFYFFHRSRICKYLSATYFSLKSLQECHSLFTNIVKHNFIRVTLVFR